MSVIYWPARDPRVTEEAGTRGGTHSGIDLAAKRGDPVLAPFDGVAVYVGGDGATQPLWLGDGWLYPKSEGRTVDIRRADGLISRVGHLEGYAIRQGQAVKAGQTVGYAGDSGYSTGVHIHWELRWDRAWSGGNWINPRTVNPQLQEDIVTPQDIEKIAKRTAELVLNTGVKRTGVDKDGKPRTGNASLRQMLASWEHQVGVTRRIIERIWGKVK